MNFWGGIGVQNVEDYETSNYTKKRDANFNFLIGQVSEVVYELHINFRKG